MHLNACPAPSDRRRSRPHLQRPAAWYHVNLPLSPGVVLTREECGIVFEACRLYEGKLWDIGALAVLPTEGVHALCSPLPPGNPYPLEAILQRVRGFSVHRINQHRGAAGEIWSRDYDHRTVRDGPDYSTTVVSIRASPVKHGVVRRERDWPWLFVDADRAVAP